MGSALNEKGVLLRDIIDIPDRVRPGDLLVSLAEGFDTSAEAIRQYVVTPQLAARPEVPARAISPDRGRVAGCGGTGRIRETDPGGTAGRVDAGGVSGRRDVGGRPQLAGPDG